ncbi:MAG TPA: hypothetical protein VEK38_02470 [Candidatus Bathyarchaeia archaeon]|nr:hypothetical protein [Candidatus Bathyarchaeia archaeon]
MKKQTYLFFTVFIFTATQNIRADVIDLYNLTNTRASFLIVVPDNKTRQNNEVIIEPNGYGKIYIPGTYAQLILLQKDNPRPGGVNLIIKNKSDGLNKSIWVLEGSCPPQNNVIFNSVNGSCSLTLKRVQNPPQIPSP